MRFFLLLACAAALYGEFRAGASKAVITPDLRKETVYLAGFGHNRVATGIHDDLYARCLALSAGPRPLVICSLDLIGLFSDDVAAVRARVPEADVMVASTHVHEGPDTMGLWGPAQHRSGIDDGYNARVVERTAKAAREALAALRPASAAPARVPASKLDVFIHDDRPPEVHDSELIVLSLADAAGKTIATAVNWANHPETLDSKNTLVTSDYAHYLTGLVEAARGGIAVFLNGAVGGMQSPLGAQVEGLADGTFAKAERIGSLVADLAITAAVAAKPVPVDDLRYAAREVRIPLANAHFRLALEANLYRGRKKLSGDGTISTQVGGVALCGGGRPALQKALVPGELYPELSLGGVKRYAGADFPDAPIEKPLKPMMRAPYRMLIGLANDEIGYIIPKAEWDEKQPWLRNAPKPWYGEVNSAGPDTASRIINALEPLLASGCNQPPGRE